MSRTSSMPRSLKWRRRRRPAAQRYPRLSPDSTDAATPAQRLTKLESRVMSVDLGSTIPRARAWGGTASEGLGERQRPRRDQWETAADGSAKSSILAPPRTDLLPGSETRREGCTEVDGHGAHVSCLKGHDPGDVVLRWNLQLAVVATVLFVKREQRYIEQRRI